MGVFMVYPRKNAYGLVWEESPATSKGSNDELASLKLLCRGIIIIIINFLNCFGSSLGFFVNLN